ncbi:MAG: extracellular solute-binding protein [bacterium]
MRRCAIILFVLIAALPFLLMWGRRPAPDSAERATTGATETLVVISPHRREIRQEYSRGFANWMRQREGRRVDIQWLDVGGASKILKELESRFGTSPDHPGVDLLFGGGVAPFLTAVQKNWLQPWEPPAGTLDDIPATCAGSPVYDPGHRWFGVTLSGFGILYNRPLLKRLGLPEPVSWELLAHPAFCSWIGSGDPRSSGSVHMCYEIILQAYGYEKGWPVIARICANVRTFGEAGGTVPREVASGDIVAGMVIDQYAQTVIQSVGDESLALVLPRQQTVISPDAIALLRGAPHAALAGLFMEYTLSRDGQRLLYQPGSVNGQRHTLYRMPVMKSLYREANAPQPNPYDYSGGLAYDNELATRRWNLLNDLMGVWLIDAHADLQSAWKTLIARGASPERFAALCAPPVTEKELEALAKKWNDPRLRQEIMQSWSLSARARYESSKH